MWVGDSRVVAGGAGVSFVLYRVLHKLHTRACLCEAGRGRPQSAGARVAHRVVDEAHDQQREHDDAEVRVCGGGARGEARPVYGARGERRETHHQQRRPPRSAAVRRPRGSPGHPASSLAHRPFLFVLWSSTSLPSSSGWAAPREVVPPPAKDLAGVNLYLLWHQLRNRSGRVMWPPSRHWQAQLDCAGRRFFF